MVLQTLEDAGGEVERRDVELATQAARATEAEEREVLLVLGQLFSDNAWAPSYCTVERVQGGVTNRMYRCTSTVTGTAVLVRIFGSGDFFNRRRENSLYAELAAAGLGPPLLGIFPRGRVEGVLTGKPLDYRTLHDKQVYSQVASALARLHCFRPSEQTLPRAQAIALQWEFCERLLRKAVERHCLPVEELCNGKPTRLQNEFKELRHRLPADDIVFCHNDLLGANILYDPTEQMIRFVDFEYAGYAPRAYDLGNHFNEWMGLTENCGLKPLDSFARYPTEAEQHRFAEAYLASLSAFSQSDDAIDTATSSRCRSASVSTLERDRLVAEANAFSLLSHWIWSVWAFIMAADPPSETFDYVHFGRERLLLMRMHWSERLGAVDHLLH